MVEEVCIQSLKVLIKRITVLEECKHRGSEPRGYIRNFVSGCRLHTAACGGMGAILPITNTTKLKFVF